MDIRLNTPYKYEILAILVGGYDYLGLGHGNSNRLTGYVLVDLQKGEGEYVIWNISYNSDSELWDCSYGTYIEHGFIGRASNAYEERVKHNLGISTQIA